MGLPRHICGDQYLVINRDHQMCASGTPWQVVFSRQARKRGDGIESGDEGHGGIIGTEQQQRVVWERTFVDVSHGDRGVGDAQSGWQSAAMES